MSAGLLFGAAVGTIIVSVAGTVCPCPVVNLNAPSLVNLFFQAQVIACLINWAGGLKQSVKSCFVQSVPMQLMVYNPFLTWSHLNDSLQQPVHSWSQGTWPVIGCWHWQKEIKSFWPLIKQLETMDFEWWPFWGWALYFPSPWAIICMAWPPSNLGPMCLEGMLPSAFRYWWHN